MQITDTIADLLTRIRNASSAKHATVDIPASNVKKAIVEILLNEGYIKSYQSVEDGKQAVGRQPFRQAQILEQLSAPGPALLSPAAPPRHFTRKRTRAGSPDQSRGRLRPPPTPPRGLRLGWRNGKVGSPFIYSFRLRRYSASAGGAERGAAAGRKRAGALYVCYGDTTKPLPAKSTFLTRLRGFR